MRLDRSHTIIFGFNRFCQCSNTSYPLVSLYVLRQHRPDLVWLRLGKSTTRNWFSRGFYLSFTRPATLSAVTSACSSLLAFAVVDIPDPYRSGNDQNSE